MVHLVIQRLSHGKDLSLPCYAHDGDAGLDFCAAEDKVIAAGETALVKTGFCVAIPSGYVGLVWDRSGLAARHAVHTLAGVIDSGYRGEIQVVLRNSGTSAFPVSRGMRVAQMLIQPVATAVVVEADALEATVRNDGGFGSTGQ